METEMPSLSSSSAWLSHDMARALAATCPPLKSGDVVRAADALADSTDPARVISRLLRLGPDLLGARGIVEALRALRDLAA
jgi:hypothetical protein